MKKLFLLLIFLTFVFSLRAQQTDWEKYDLKGKVKQVKATTTHYSGRCAACIDYVEWTCITEFDTQGNAVKNIFGMLGKTPHKSSFTPIKERK